MFAAGDDDSTFADLGQRGAGALTYLGFLPPSRVAVIAQAMPGTVVRCLQDIVTQPVGMRCPVLFPQAFPDCHFRVSAGQEAALVGIPGPADRKAQNDRRPIFCQQFHQFFIVALRHRSQETSFEGASGDAVEAGHDIVGLYDDPQDVIGLALDVLAQNLDTIAFDPDRLGGTIQRYPAPGFFCPGLGIVTQRVRHRCAPKHDGRRPHFADQDLVVSLDPVIGRPEVEVLRQTTDMVLVRMGVEKTIDEEPTLFVALQLLAQQAHDVGRVVIRVVGTLADVDIDQQRLIVVEPQQRHVAVADRVKRDGSRHCVVSFLPEP